MPEKEVAHLSDKEKVKLVSYAARITGHEQVEYALEHALVFYLMHKRFRFNYTFAIRADPGLMSISKIPDYPWSKALDNDISELVSLGYLSLKPGSLYLTWNNERNNEIPKYRAVLEQENESFDKMSEIVDNSLRNKSHFIRACYKLYLKRI